MAARCPPARAYAFARPSTSAAPPSRGWRAVRGQRRVRVERGPHLRRRHAELIAKRDRECRWVVVADPRRDLGDRIAPALEQLERLLEPPPPQIGERRDAELL